MLNNSLVEEIIRSSDIDDYVLSEDDSRVIIDANRSYKGETFDLDNEKALQIDRAVSEQLVLSGSLLELSCGNGFLFRNLKSDKSDCCYYGLDISMNQLASFGINADSNLPVNLVCGSVTQIPFRNESFDLVFGHSFLHHIHDVPSCISEAYRVLRPGGKFILTHEPSSTAPFFECFPVGLYKDPRTPSLEDLWLFTLDDLVRLMGAAGFSSSRYYSKGIFVNLTKGIDRVLQKVGVKSRLYNHDEREYDLSLRIDALLSRIGFLKKVQPSLSVVAVKSGHF